MGWSSEDIPDLTGRVVVVTGANSGIGLETSAALAGAGATVVMACRSLDKAGAARDELRQRVPAGTFELVRLDLADQGQIATAAAEVLERFPRIDRLINNGGVMSIPQSTTVDGFETVFGTNHLGHFALTARLLPGLLAADGARVVTVSSLSARVAKVRWDDLHQERSYSQARAYAQSKLANLLFAFELQRRAAAAGVDLLSAAAHPGMASTGIAHSFEERHPLVGTVMRRGFEWMLPSTADAARPSLRAATAPDVAGGAFFGPGHVGGFSGAPTPTTPPRRSLDPTSMTRLWDLSVDAIGVEWAFA